jgi:hypothetical protein
MIRKYPSLVAYAEVKNLALACATAYNASTQEATIEAEHALEAALLKHGLMTQDEAIDAIEYDGVDSPMTHDICHGVFILFDGGDTLTIYCDQE